MRSYEVPIARPRDPLGARTHPAFGDLLTRLWQDLSEVSDEAVSDEAAPVRAAAGGAR